ncbi:MAG TPA: GNAT family N-acetyltransferase [Myxococcaceae bacterium]
MAAPPPSLTPDLFSALPRGREIWIRVWGRSLLPLLRSGDLVRAVRCGESDIRPGDIAVIRRRRGPLVGHIVTSVGPVRTASFLGVPDAPGAEVLGRAIAVRREGLPFALPLPRAGRPLLFASHRVVARAYANPSVRRGWRSLRELAASDATAPLRGRLFGPFLVRRLQPEDSEGLLAFAGRRLRFTPDFVRRELHGHWQAPGAAFGAFDRKGRLVGFMFMGEYRQEGVPLEGLWLRGLLVARRARGLGLARRLMEATCARAREAGLHTVFTDVREDNRASLSLVRAMGFVEAPPALQEAAQRSLARPGEPRVIAFERRLA